MPATRSALVYDDKKLRANLKDRLFDITVARYAANWPTRARGRSRRSRSAAGADHAAGAERAIPLRGIDPAGQHHERRAAAGAEPRRRQSQAAASDAAPPTNSAPGVRRAEAAARRARAAKTPRRRRCRSTPRQAISA